jgi:hypothetical protein
MTTQWKDDLFFAVNFAGQKHSKNYTEETTIMRMLLISAQILNPFRKLELFRKCNKAMANDPEDEISYTTQYQEAILKYAENEYYAKHRCGPVNKVKTVPSSNLLPSAIASGSYQTFFDPYDLSSDDEASITPKNVAERKTRPSNRTARLSTAASFYFNSLSEAPKHWGQINPNLNDYHFDPKKNSRTFWIPDTPDWWRQQEEKHSMYTALSNVARVIFSIIRHGF